MRILLFSEIRAAVARFKTAEYLILEQPPDRS